MSNGNGCPNCELLEKALADLQSRFEELERKFAAATKNSTNRSKPPSSDIVKPIRPRKPTKKCKKGGQKGHQRTVRPAVPEDELDWLTQYSYEQCPCCGGPVTTDTENPVSTVQQIEIVRRTETTEHQSLASHCAACDKTHVCTIPPEIRFVVIDRKVTQGSKSESGQRWLERIWTVLATCTAQDKSLLDGLRTSLQHFFRGERPPPLLPAG